MKLSVITSAFIALLASAPASAQPVYLSATSTYLRTSGLTLADSISYTYDPSRQQQYLSNISDWNYSTAYRETTQPLNRAGQFKVARTFDGQGNVTVDEVEKFDGTAYVPYTRETRSYDATGNVLVYETELPHRTRITTTYNASNQPTLILTEMLSGGTWINKYRTTNIYNANNLIEQELTDEFVGGAWTGLKEVLYTYNGMHATTIIAQDAWPGGSATRELNTFDAAGNIIVTERQLGYTGNSNWSNHRIFYCTYDAAGNTLSDDWQRWGGSSYNKYRLAEKAYITIAGHSYIQQSRGSDWDISRNIYETSDSTYYHYQLPAGIESSNTTVASAGISIYPIPAGNYVNMIFNTPTQHYTAMLLDASGKLVKTFSGNGRSSQSLDVQDIPAGNYLLQVYTGNNASFEKLVIAR